MDLANIKPVLEQMGERSHPKPDAGNCANIGKFKVPTLRGLASRAPYFHNGSAKTLADVVNFYEEHFTIGLTPKDKTDLINFLNAL
jgi:cytochrome c peroxidase